MEEVTSTVKNESGASAGAIWYPGATGSAAHPGRLKPVLEEFALSLSTEHEPDATALISVPRGMRVLFDGNRLARVPDSIADGFQPGDQLLVIARTGEILHVPAAIGEVVNQAVNRARAAFSALASVNDAAITQFFRHFAARLANDAIWAKIAVANAEDVDRARSRSRSTVRLEAGARMRRDMIEGLGAWERIPSTRGTVEAVIAHDGWTVEQVVDGLGVIGFVFEGRPNVFADAAGILRGGNTAVLRIGGDALGTARAISKDALRPALREAGLPLDAVTLLDRVEHAAGWALFANRQLSLAVARGSGRAVTLLGEVARQAGTPVSLHGTGGAWLIADAHADPARFHAALFHSLDRKVCNTANVVLIEQTRAAELAPIALRVLRERGEALGHGFKLHVAANAVPFVPADLFRTTAPILRAGGLSDEPIAEILAQDDLDLEWEWEHTPEVSLALVGDLDEAIQLFDRYSPRFVATLISQSETAQNHFFRRINAPFVGDGFTRWVDGQYALNRPELGLSNWQFGRLFARGGVLSGDGVYTRRLRARQSDLGLHR